MDVDEDENEDVETPRKFRFVFLLPHVFAFFTNVSMAWRVLFSGITDDLSNHSAHIANRDLFEQSAGAEIERMVKGEVDG